MWPLFLSHVHAADQEAVTCILASTPLLVAHLGGLGCFPLQKVIVLRDRVSASKPGYSEIRNSLAVSQVVWDTFKSCHLKAFFLVQTDTQASF